MRFVVVGGGVAGVCCAEELCRLRPDDSVTLVAADKLLKGVSVVARLSRCVEELALVERRLDELPYPNLTMVQDVAAGLDTRGKALLLGSGGRLPYDRLCICAGARPKQLPPGVLRTDGRGMEELQQRVLTIRDTDSVQRLAQRLRCARRVVVVGNGGIALELVSGLQGADVTWIMKHAHIGDAYFDLDAAQFLLEELQQQRRMQQGQQAPTQQVQQQAAQAPTDGGAQAAADAAAPGQGGEQQGQQQQRAEEPQQAQQVGQPAAPAERQQGAQQGVPTAAVAAAASDGSGSPRPLGHAVGPRWAQHLPPGAGAAGNGGSVQLEYGCEIASIELVRPWQQDPPGQQANHSSGTPSGEPCLLLTLSTGKQLHADLVLLAIGVRPALEWVPPSVERAPDGGLRLNRFMQTSDAAIYAAGDSASCQWAASESRHWFQMRLWSQARSMGIYAAHCMAEVQDQMGADMAFELFTHVTRFLGKKVVLLGLYNGQRLQDEPEEDMVTYSRVTEGPDRTFVRVLLLRGQMQGAVLIGDTDLEETFENLIMDQLDVSQYGPDLLDPDVELDHVFD